MTGRSVSVRPQGSGVLNRHPFHQHPEELTIPYITDQVIRIFLLFRLPSELLLKVKYAPECCHTNRRTIG